MTEQEVEFVGGQHDGLRAHFAEDTVRSGCIVLPLPQPIGILLDLEGPPAPTRTAIYRVALDDSGYPSRADDGCVRFRFQHAM